MDNEVKFDHKDFVLRIRKWEIYVNDKSVVVIPTHQL